MPALKRKEGPGAPAASKSARPASESRPTKRAKSGETGAKPQKETESKSISAPITSVLKDEEPLFPRGGGSVLTPLEQKEIQLQAKHDALFEVESAKPGKKGDKGSKKQKRKSKGEDTQVTTGEDAVKIESLNFKVRYILGTIGHCAPVVNNHTAIS